MREKIAMNDDNNTQKEFHVCKALVKQPKISIEKIGRHWFWCFWDDKKGNTAHGIRYCPYCGDDLLRVGE